MLVWAKHRSGQSIEEVAKALGKEPATIESWEAGSSAPTYPQLEELAYRVYKRPVALFFFPEPPDEPDPDDRYIGTLAGDAKRIEVFCNRFAAELLVPRTDFLHRIRGLQVDDETVAELAGEYKVSREVILRRLRDQDLISQTDYEERTARWRREYEDHPRGEGGGNYYATKASYLGESYLRLAFSRFYQGAISLEQLADFLNVRVRSVPGLEQLVLQRAAG